LKVTKFDLGVLVEKGLIRILISFLRNINVEILEVVRLAFKVLTQRVRDRGCVGVLVGELKKFISDNQNEKLKGAGFVCLLTLFNSTQVQTSPETANDIIEYLFVQFPYLKQENTLSLIRARVE
jgi:hypothetical protein